MVEGRRKKQEAQEQDARRAVLQPADTRRTSSTVTSRTEAVDVGEISIDRHCIKGRKEHILCFDATRREATRLETRRLTERDPRACCCTVRSRFCTLVHPSPLAPLDFLLSSVTRKRERERKFASLYHPLFGAGAVCRCLSRPNKYCNAALCCGAGSIHSFDSSD